MTILRNTGEKQHKLEFKTRHHDANTLLIRLLNRGDGYESQNSAATRKKKFHSQWEMRKKKF
jgi:hypothetical protein